MKLIDLIRFVDLIRFTMEEKRVEVPVSVLGFSHIFSVPSEIRMDTPHLILIATIRKKYEHGDGNFGIYIYEVSKGMIAFKLVSSGYIDKLEVLWGGISKMSERNLPCQKK